MLGLGESDEQVYATMKGKEIVKQSLFHLFQQVHEIMWSGPSRQPQAGPEM